MSSDRVKFGVNGGDRDYFVLDAIPENARKILDIGCGYGHALSMLAREGKEERELWGIDMDPKGLEEARKYCPGVHFVEQTAARLPFDDETFDVAILSEVIEHVGNENKQMVIDEAYRILKPGGTFIFTAPYAGLFAWCDPMDVKRRATWLYRIYMRVSGYSPKDSIDVGHEHVSTREIETLFGERFRIGTIRYCGFFMPLFTWILTIGERCRLMTPNAVRRLNLFRGWESGVVYPRPLCFNVRLVATKVPAQRRSDSKPEILV